MTIKKQHNHITLALDIEGTLLSQVSKKVPRPGLYQFLEFCHGQFERVVFLSFVDEERGRAVLNSMADSGHMPDWVRTAEYFQAIGGRPGAKDLRQLGVDPEQAVLVDDQPQVLPREQLHRLVQVPEFKEPFDEDDRVLKDVRSRLQSLLEEPCPSHQKLIARDTSLGPVIFADYYHFGSDSGDCPLIIYTGGAISSELYQQRLATKPLAVVQEFSSALKSTGHTTADLLVLPFPSEPDGTVHQQLFSILLMDLLRQTPNPRPSRIGCVGFSLGASFASYLTFSLKQVKTLATVGGYGMSEGANESTIVGEIKERKYQAWWNADSTGYMENLFFLHLLTKHDATMDIITGSGGHEFTDYAVNGAVRSAFEFVLNAINR